MGISWDPTDWHEEMDSAMKMLNELKILILQQAVIPLILV
jgi:hypothetical protein